ncbi:MAG: hypothetical protein K0R57_216 [Paenibacillaceae bacterium]|jgi:predicted glycoside hydrolase/deacetylase ChbG (UPF0249 family)|nr:hypothetical protein [Paenibacillaceae bacterium]
MKERIYLITRGDDTGNSRSANQAVMQAYREGILKNTSFMPVGQAAAHGAALFAGTPGLCLGLHAVLNSEWEHEHYYPALPPSEVPSLVREGGMFHPTPRLTREAGARVEQIMAELRAQLALARSMGLSPVYVDTHMVFEWIEEKLAGLLEEWCRQEGLVYYRRYNRRLPQAAETGDAAERLLAALDAADPGLYTLVTHPCFDDEEVRRFTLPQLSGEEVARARDEDRRMLIDPRITQYMNQTGVIPIRYDEAARLFG